MTTVTLKSYSTCTLHDVTTVCRQLISMPLTRDVNDER